VGRGHPVPDFCYEPGLTAIQPKPHLLGDVAYRTGVGCLEIDIGRAKKHLCIE
jgi:hypothetical protein